MTLVRKYGEGEATCSQCGKRDLKLLRGTRIRKATDRKRRYKHEYVNGEGKSWYGARCPDCYALQEARRKGCLPRELQTAPHLIRGFRSEALAVRHLKAMNYYDEVTHLGGVGQPDIVVRVGDDRLKVEVKTVIPIRKKGLNSKTPQRYCITRITKKEMEESNLYALVFPDDRVALVEAWLADFRDTPPRNSNVSWARSLAK